MRYGRGHSYEDRADESRRLRRLARPVPRAQPAGARPAGSLFVHLDYRAVHYVKVALDRTFGREQFVNEIVWCYAVGGKSRRGFGRKHDTILWYARGADWAFYPDAVRVPRRGGSHMRVVLDGDARPRRPTGAPAGSIVAVPAGKVPETGGPTSRPSTTPTERVGLALPEARAAHRAHPPGRGHAGDHVADWFSGSATTAAVAQRLGRSFLAVDRDAAAIELCAARLAAQGRALAAAGTPPPAITIQMHRTGSILGPGAYDARAVG